MLSGEILTKNNNIVYNIILLILILFNSNNNIIIISFITAVVSLYLLSCIDLWNLLDSFEFHSIMLTYIHVKNCGYIVAYFQVVVSRQFLAYIQYMGHSFIGFLTLTAFGVFIYCKYLCLVMLSVQSLVLSGCY